MHDSLVRRFADAGLTLVLSKSSIIGGLRGGAGSIVQIDVQRSVNGSRRHEWFRIFPGADDNRIEVVGTDKRLGQVVLLVHEAEREFTEGVSRWSLKGVDLTQPGWKAAVASKVGVRVSDILGTPKAPLVRRRTSSEKRHFLMGVDERQLFIAQLRKGCSTVREAHASLKTTTVSLAEGQGLGAIRQGEWFLIEATAAELANIEEGITKNLLVIEHNVPIGPFTDSSVRGGRGKRVRQFVGNPHTADELIVLPGRPLVHGWPVREREVFIRGRVRHVDHATVKTANWRKVIRNSESNAGRAAGVGWVD